MLWASRQVNAARHECLVEPRFVSAVDIADDDMNVQHKCWSLDRRKGDRSQLIHISLLVPASSCLHFHDAAY